MVIFCLTMIKISVINCGYMTLITIVIIQYCFRLIMAVCLLKLINCCVTLSYITDKKSIKYNFVLLSNIIDHKSYFNCYQTFTGCLISHHRIIVTKVFNNINSSPKKCQIFWIKSRLK